MLVGIKLKFNVPKVKHCFNVLAQNSLDPTALAAVRALMDSQKRLMLGSPRPPSVLGVKIFSFEMEIPLPPP